MSLIIQEIVCVVMVPDLDYLKFGYKKTFRGTGRAYNDVLSFSNFIMILLCLNKHSSYSIDVKLTEIQKSVRYFQNLYKL